MEADGGQWPPCDGFAVGYWEGEPIVTNNKAGKPKATRFKVGDHVGWNSEAGRVSGTIVKVHTSDFDYKGHTHRASKDDPQYEIKSDKTDHIAAHKGGALTRLAK
jgi:hypothetical protein